MTAIVQLIAHDGTSKRKLNCARTAPTKDCKCSAMRYIRSGRRRV
jgi:hypothetical protein